MDSDKPALAPPPGIQSNFDDPPNGNIEAHFGVAICIFIVFVSGSLRAYSKIVCMKKVKLEDYVGLVALAPYVAFIYSVYDFMRTVGIYVHQWDIRASDLPSALYIVYINTSFFKATMGTVKTAILLEWAHLFVPPGTRTTFWWTCQIVMWVNILYYISSIVVSAISCFPHEKIWHPTLPGTCFNTKAFIISNATLNLVSDIIILALPQRLIWNLKMSRQKKIGVSLVFAVGVIACLVGAARLSRGVIYYLSDDNLYNVSAIFLWYTAELSVSFLIFCLPAIPKIFSSDNWIKRFMTWLYSGLSFSKIRSTDISGADQKIPAWKSSMLSRGSTFEAEWGHLSSLPNAQYGRITTHSRVEANNINAIKNYIPKARSLGRSEPYAQAPRLTLWPIRHDPLTSWYEEGP
ncbi:hypothetical protein F5Y12DRAFT_639887 [Xylaria sp. FL1777]|nr:hypothetical protein F5Y12DRAFT_639887 [Xylaria sp. FL1777]